MKIGIDVDDTLTNTKEQQLKYWKEYYNNNPRPGYSTVLPKTINDFEDAYVQEFWDAYRLKLNFDCSVKEGVSLYTKKLKEDGHTLCIVTSRPDEKYDNLQKLMHDWIDKNNITIDIVYTDVRDKGTFCKENNFDLLIDDDIKHIKKATELNVKAILFNDNPDYDGLKTTSWQELYELISTLNKK